MRGRTAAVVAAALAAVTAAVVAATSSGRSAPATAWAPPPPNAEVDYQIGGDYPPPAGVTVVLRDWFSGTPLTGAGAYSICYVNAFQTQEDEPDVDRPDERSAWPADLVLTPLGEDPNWAGEYLVDLGTPARRTAALEHLMPMIDTCAAKGFAAVEYDNLDSWTRFDGTPLADRVPFDQADAVAFAELITDYAHSLGLAVAQKNAPQLTREQSLTQIGFDFAIAEECGYYDECTAYTAVFGTDVIAVEYTDDGFTRACEAVGASVSVVRRDRLVSLPGSPTYRYDHC